MLAREAGMGSGSAMRSCSGLAWSGGSGKGGCEGGVPRCTRRASSSDSLGRAGGERGGCGSWLSCWPNKRAGSASGGCSVPGSMAAAGKDEGMGEGGPSPN
eukprot:1157887-Pelagomonas_calceolata.AAC.8